MKQVNGTYDQMAADLVVIAVEQAMQALDAVETGKSYIRMCGGLESAIESLVRADRFPSSSIKRLRKTFASLASETRKKTRGNRKRRSPNPPDDSGMIDLRIVPRPKGTSQ